MSEPAFNSHRFYDRFNTGDGTPHGDFIVSRFDYAKKTRNKVLTDEYTAKLKHIPLTELAAVWSDLQDPNYALAIVPSIEAVIARWKFRKKIQGEKRQEAESRRAKPVPVGEKQTALSAAHAAYALKICNSIGVAVPIPVKAYKGNFPLKEFIDKQPVPEHGPDTHKPDRYFQAMVEDFNRAWGEYAG